MKFKDIFLLGIILVLIVLLFIFLQKRPISLKRFRAVAERNQLKVVSVTKLFHSVPEIKEAVFAESENSWQIEYYVFDSSKNAQKWIQNKKKEHQMKYANHKTFIENKKRNYQEYTLLTNQLYIHVYQNKNTILYVNVSSDYYEEVSKIVKELN